MSENVLNFEEEIRKVLNVDDKDQALEKNFED